MASDAAIILDILSNQACMINMQCNVGKTVCIVFTPRNRKMQITSTFPVFNIGGLAVQFVHSLPLNISVILSTQDFLMMMISNVKFVIYLWGRIYLHVNSNIAHVELRRYCLKVTVFAFTMPVFGLVTVKAKLISYGLAIIGVSSCFSAISVVTVWLKYCLTWGCTVLIQYYQTAVLYLETNCMHVITILLVIYCRSFLIVVGSSFILSFLCVCFFCYMDHCCLN